MKLAGVHWIDAQPELNRPLRRLALTAKALRALAVLALLELFSALLLQPWPGERALRQATWVMIILLYAAWALQRAALLSRLRRLDKSPP